jgi:hypothetical protein
MAAMISKAMAERIKSDPVYFVTLCSPLKPYDYQEVFLRDNDDRFIVKKGRQVGASQMVAWKATWYAFTNDETTVLIVSPSQRQSGIIFRKIKNFIKNSRYLRGSVERETWTEIELTNGSQIVSLPSGDEGDTIRGYTAELLIADEAAFMKDAVFNAIEDSTIRGGKRVYISTPYGVNNRFHKMWKNPDWTKQHIPSTMCPDISPKEIERKKREKSYIEFQQEVMGEFVETSSLFFDPETLKDALVHKNVAQMAQKVDTHQKILACDPARHGNDLGVIIEAYKVGNNILISRIWAWSDKPLTHYMGTIKDLHEKHRYSAVLIDETGLGGGVVDVLKEDEDDDLKRIVQGVTFSDKNKTMLYTNAKNLFDEETIMIPSYLKYTGSLLNQLANIEYEVTRLGGTKIISKNDDFADAFVLVVWGSKRMRGTGYFKGY